MCHWWGNTSPLNVTMSVRQNAASVKYIVGYTVAVINIHKPNQPNSPTIGCDNGFVSSQYDPSPCSRFGCAGLHTRVVAVWCRCWWLRPMPAVLLQLLASQGPARNPDLPTLWRPVPLRYAVQSPAPLPVVLSLLVHNANWEEARTIMEVWATGNLQIFQTSEIKIIEYFKLVLCLKVVFSENLLKLICQWGEKMYFTLPSSTEKRQVTPSVWR